MAWQHLLILGLAGLAVAPAVHATLLPGTSLEVGTSLELKAAGAGNRTLDVSVGAGGRDTGLEAGPYLSVKLLRSVVRKLLRLGGRAFFRILVRAFPITSSLYALIRSPAPTNPETVNQILDEFCVSLNKMVEEKILSKEKAEQLHKQTIKELKSELKTKVDTVLIKDSCGDL